MEYLKYDNMNLTGTVLRIEKSSIFDGDGIRTVIFTKGCPLRCAWCSTPESQDTKIQASLDNKIIYGSIMSVEEVITEIRKDIPFYFHSGGGMTVSGGEILVQPTFVKAILKQCMYEGINTCIETTLLGPWENVKEILSYTDTAFVDLKFMDDKLHMKYTGVSNKLILENIKKAGSKKSDTRIIIRRPIIPGLNDTEEELISMGQFLNELPGITHVQLLPYHRLGTDTYRKLGIKYPLKEIEVPTSEYMENCKKLLEKYVKTIL